MSSEPNKAITVEPEVAQDFLAMILQWLSSWLF
ncbi:MAG: hypothetical protein JWO65_2506 [Sphingomonas bacterium]|nr:hypothetical protein [Sphingomonas bacterium]